MKKLHGLIGRSRYQALLVAAALGGVGGARAVPIDLNDGAITGSVDSTLTFGFGVRAKNPSCGLTGDPSSAGCGASANTNAWSAGDDGNLNYHKGDVFTAYGKGTHEVLLKAPEYGLAFMGRFSYLVDPAATHTQRTELGSEAKKQVAQDFRLLDLWLSKTFLVDGQTARVRLGNQVINWGESLFLAGGINATAALDYQRLMIPGTQLKEAVLPAPMISLAGDLGKGLQGEAYYQFGWNRNRYAPIGTYWSAADFFDKGARQAVSFNGNNFNATGLDAIGLARRDNPGAQGRVSPAVVQQYNQQLLSGGFAADAANSAYGAGVAADVQPKTGGQFGLSGHFKPESLPMDIGAYYLRYHDKAPVLNLVKSAASAAVDYQAQFLENRELFGLSTNFPLGNWAVGTELSYRPREAIALGGCFTPGQPLNANLNFNPVASGNCPLWANNKKVEFHLTGMMQLMPAEHGAILGLLGADTAWISAEAVLTRYPGVNPNGMTRTVDGVKVTQLPAAGYGTWLDAAGLPKGVGSANQSTLIADFNWTYDSTVITGWQLTPGLTYFRGLTGDTPTFAANSMAGVQSANVYLLFNQNPAKWQAGLNYTTYFGGGARNFYGDRAFYGGFVSYNF